MASLSGTLQLTVVNREKRFVKVKILYGTHISEFCSGSQSIGSASNEVGRCCVLLVPDNLRCAIYLPTCFESFFPPIVVDDLLGGSLANCGRLE